MNPVLQIVLVAYLLYLAISRFLAAGRLMAGDEIVFKGENDAVIEFILGLLCLILTLLLIV